MRPYLSEQIAQDLELADVNPLAEAKALFYRVRTMLDKSEDAEDLPAFKALHSEARRDLELLAKLLGDLRTAACRSTTTSTQGVRDNQAAKSSSRICSRR